MVPGQAREGAGVGMEGNGSLGVTEYPLCPWGLAGDIWTLLGSRRREQGGKMDRNSLQAKHER